MGATREQWNYGDASIWAGRYRNSHNHPHWHYDCELLRVDKGSLDIHCDGENYTLSPGQAFFIDSGQVHYMHACSPDTELTMLVFSYDLIAYIIQNKALATPLLSSDYGITEIYGKIKTELTEKSPYYGVRSTLLAVQLMTDIFRNETLVGKDTAGRSVDSFKALLVDMEKNYAEYTLDTAAEFMSMNAAYFSRLFHKMTGRTFISYVNYLKCLNAVKMLQSEHDATVTEISIKCGFPTIRSFNRTFKQYTGYNPSSLPEFYVMKDTTITLDPTERDPTDSSSILIESTDGRTSSAPPRS